MKKFAVLAAVSVMSLAPLAVMTSADAASQARTFRNCTELNRVFPHGVGRPGAVDRTTGARVANFKRDRALYNANSKSDRDKDGIACEKR